MKTKLFALCLTAIFALGATLASAAPAEENWENLCAKCHGADGKADTKMGKKLKIRDYTEKSFQDAVKDEDLIVATKDGVKDGDKERMDGFSDELSEEEIVDLVKLIRSFGPK